MDQQVFLKTDLIQTISLLVTISGLIVAIAYNIKQIKRFNLQLKLNFFADYTKRYQQIILNFPENINEEGFDFSDLNNDVRDKTMRYIRVYFDLCSEEFDLWMEDYIEDRIWENWRSGICFALSKKAFQYAWDIIKSDTIYYEDFKEWVEEIIVANGEKEKLKEINAKLKEMKSKRR